MTLWTKGRKALALIVSALVLCSASYGFGRYASPTRVETRTELKLEERIVYRNREVKVAGPVRVVTKRVEVPGPTGPVITTERVVERGAVLSLSDQQTSQLTLTEAKEQRLELREAPRLTLLFGIGLNATRPTQLVYSGDVLYRVGGPVVLGAYGDSTLTFLVKAGLSW